MGLDARIHYKTFARVDLKPNVEPRFWARLFDAYKVGLNFDGELLGLGEQFDRLVDVGFRWKDETTSEICMNTTNGRAQWLKLVKIVPDDISIEPFDAWMLENSRCNFVQCNVTEMFFVRDVNSHWEQSD
jgi:hypothetical protein